MMEHAAAFGWVVFHIDAKAPLVGDLDNNNSATAAHDGRGVTPTDVITFGEAVSCIDEEALLLATSTPWPQVALIELPWLPRLTSAQLKRLILVFMILLWAAMRT